MNPRRLGPFLGLALLAFGVYANSLFNGFVSDDHFQLLSNPLVTNYRWIPDIFLKYVRALEANAISNYYRPMQMLFYMAVYYSAGFNAFPYHLLMVLLHMGNTLLVYSLGKRLLPSSPGALVAAALFAVHPIHTEAVLWVASFPDLLVTLLSLIAIQRFSKQDGKPRDGQVAGLFALYLLALLTKESGAMLLPLLAGYEWLYLGKRPRDLWKNRALYAALLGAGGLYLVLRVGALGGFAPAQGLHHHLSHGEYFLSVVVTAGQYLLKLVLPTGLQYYHQFEATRTITPVFVSSLIALLSLLAVIFLAPSMPLVRYGLFWILATLAPVMNLTGVGENVFAERYLYLPSAGLVWIAGLAWPWLAGRQKRLAWAIAAAILVAGSLAVVRRNADWHDDLRLFTVSAKQSPRSGTLHADVGWAYLQRGDYDRAVEEYHIALELQPDVASHHMNLGNALAMKGQNQEAAVAIRRAILLKPSYAAYFSLGQTLESLGDFNGAAASYGRAAALRPDSPWALTALGLLRLRTKNAPAAIELFQEAIAANAGFPEAYLGLGTAYNETASYAKGAEALRKAIETGPHNRNLYLAHYQLGISYLNLGAPLVAAAEFRSSSQLRPDFQEAREALLRLASPH